MKYLIVCGLWLFAACDGAQSSMPSLVIGTNATQTCGAQDQPCCAAGAGASTCNATLTCDGFAFASAQGSTTDGLCGTYGGDRQPCGPSGYCFQPHTCMTNGSTSECIDTDGGGLTCGNTGQACCREIAAGPGGSDTRNATDGPSEWCHLGLRCVQGNCGA